MVASHLAVWPMLTPVPLDSAAALGAFCAILGHIYTVWLGFKGGKGVATAFGVFLALAPWVAVVALSAFILVLAISRYVSLASIMAAIAIPISAILLPHTPYSPWILAVIVVVPTIVVVKHHQNIGRLLRGTEYRFGKTGTTA